MQKNYIFQQFDEDYLDYDIDESWLDYCNHQTIFIGACIIIGTIWLALRIHRSKTKHQL